jgi:hypothetical protein
MEYDFHQGESLGATNRKRQLHQADEPESWGNDEQSAERSKRARAAGDLPSQLSQYGDSVASQVDHSFISLNGALGAVAQNATDPSQSLAIGAEPVLDMGFPLVDLSWDWSLDLDACQNHFSGPDFQFTQTPVCPSYEPLVPSYNSDVHLAWANTASFDSPQELRLSNGMVSQEKLDYMDIEAGTDFPVPDTIDTRESSAFSFDHSPFAHSMAMTEDATANTTPQAEEDGTGCGAEDSADNAICDTCFGMLIIDTTQLRDSFVKGLPAAGKKVLLEEYGGLIIIRHAESHAYGGLLEESDFKPVSNLITDTTVTLSAILKSATLLEITVYGPRSKADEIGGMLLDHDCFLQQPDSCDESMIYFNPQCLTRGDGDDSPPTFKTDPETTTASLTVSEKSKVAELLDSASGPSVFRHVQCSEMLRTELKECVYIPPFPTFRLCLMVSCSHQRKALAMMVEKEAGILEGAEFPSIWKEETVLGGTGGMRYINTVTASRVYRKPKLCLGGLIADDMGLGKSLTALALIAGSMTTRDSNESQPTTRVTTIIVAPLSSTLLHGS